MQFCQNSEQNLLQVNCHTHTTVLWLSGFCQGQPVWDGTWRNIHPLTTIMVIMFLLVLAHLGCPGQYPESCKTVVWACVCVCVCVCHFWWHEVRWDAMTWISVMLSDHSFSSYNSVHRSRQLVLTIVGQDYCTKLSWNWCDRHVTKCSNWSYVVMMVYVLSWWSL